MHVTAHASSLPRPTARRWEPAVRLELPFSVDRPVLALGPELKNTVCILHGRTAELSAVHGDLSKPDDYRSFVRAALAARDCASGPETPDSVGVVAHDLHPTYASSLFARRFDVEPIAVQHHHAHAVACAVDAGVALPVIGIVCDGTGYGSDGAVWGGEVLLCRADSFERLAHLAYFPLPGGDAAAKSPWRSADSVIRAAFNDGPAWRHHPKHNGVAQADRVLVARQIETSLNAPRTSSLGRLFDAVSSILGLATHNTHEGEAAIKLQAAAEVVDDKHSRVLEPYSFQMSASPGVPACLDWRPLIRAMVEENGRDAQPQRAAFRFHVTVADMFVDAVVHAAADHDVDRVALSGGCFLNSLLTRLITERVKKQGLRVLTHRRVPCGDAGLSLGQAVVATACVAAR